MPGRKTKSEYKHHYETYQGTEEQKKKRAARNKARRMMEKEGKVHKGDGKDVNHKRPLRSGGTSSRGNLEVQSRSKNRGHGASPGKRKR